MATVTRLGADVPSRAPGTALEDPRTARLDPVLARFVRAGKVGPEVAAQATAQARATREGVAAVLSRLGLVPGREWAEAVAEHHGLQLVAAEEFPKEPLLAGEISARFLRHAAVLPVAVEPGRLWLAMADPANTYAQRAVAMASGREVVPVVAALEDLQQAYTRYWDAGSTALQRIVDDLGTEFDVSGGDPDVEHLIGAAQEAPVVRLVNQLSPTRCARARRTSTSSPAATSSGCATASTAGCARWARRRPGWRRRWSRASRSWRSSTSPSGGCRRTGGRG
jgi:hypothetical protein